jgi:hypothetical protein
MACSARGWGDGYFVFRSSSAIFIPGLYPARAEPILSFDHLIKLRRNETLVNRLE